MKFLTNGGMNLADIINPDLKPPGEETKWGYRIASETEYRRFPALNNSLLKCSTLAEMWAQLQGTKFDSEALKLGNLADMVVLTPDLEWQDRFAVIHVPTNTTTGKPYQAGKQYDAAVEAGRAANPGKHLVSLEEMKGMLEEAREIKQAVFSHALCAKWLDDSIKQVSGFLFHPVWKCWVKWKPDIVPLKPDAKAGYSLRDFKTSAQHVQRFEKEAHKFGYFDQAKWYSHCHEQLMLSRGARMTVENFDFIVVGKSEAGTTSPRPAMARAIRVPLDPDANLHMSGPQGRLFPQDGMGRVERFLGALDNHLAAMPDPANPIEIAQVWPGYEFDPEPWILAKEPYNPK